MTIDPEIEETLLTISWFNDRQIDRLVCQMMQVSDEALVEELIRLARMQAARWDSDQLFAFVDKLVTARRRRMH